MYTVKIAYTNFIQYIAQTKLSKLLKMIKYKTCSFHPFDIAYQKEKQGTVRIVCYYNNRL
ncbi:hypothetical protein MYP_295 [Sporocytophaga myxococcoides]|uniref:Uncharacterized protein n=1 Tax=Sporocytophaga myxococcoides TaxID=153721 RepID=A0A098L9J9_9BACT|nr:hypothetical protein MYP_295 [Sporocytophaga myxococcoides]